MKLLVINEEATNDINSNLAIIRRCAFSDREADMVLTAECFLCHDTDYYDHEQMKAAHESLANLAIELNLAICYGALEKDLDDFYISQYVVFPDQEGYKYRKVHLGKNEKLMCKEGSSIDTFNFRHVTFGVQICIETHINELSIMHRRMGASIILAPFNTPYSISKRMTNWKKYITTRAYDYNLVYACSNRSGGALLVNGKGQIIDEREVVGDSISYTISDVDYNQRVDFFSYRKPSLYEL